MYSWLHARCIEGFGEVYCSDLLGDFVDFLDETQMLSRSPGRVVFGKELACLGFEKRKISGLTFWAGIRLKNQSIEQATRPHQYAKSLAKQMCEKKARNVMLKAEESIWERIRNGELVF